MLVLKHGTRFRAGSSYNHPCYWCIRNCFSTAVYQVLDEIPKTDELPQFDIDTYSAASSVNVLEQKCHYKEYKNVHLDRESGNAETVDSLSTMSSLGSNPTKFAICTALNACAKTQNMHLGIQIHAQVVKFGYEENLYLNSALVDLYGKCYIIGDAKKIFCSMKLHDHVSWTSIISGLSQNGCSNEAILMFKNMLSTHFKPNCFTYVSVISSCTGLEEDFKLGSMLHAHVFKLGFNENTFILSSLIDCYSKWGRIDEAELLFYESKDGDNILFNSMISGYSQNLYSKKALKLFVEMRYNNLSPTDYTLNSVLNSCGSLAVRELGRQVHSIVTKMGSESNVFVVCALIDMYSKCGGIDEACRIFDQKVEKNSVLWTSMISGFSQSGRELDALELFERLMEKNVFSPDRICFTAVLTACKNAGFLDKGIEYFNKMERDYGLFPQLDQYACLVDLYARNGQLREARELMEKMPYEPNYVMWCSFLGSCKVHGEVELGSEAAYQLIEMEPCNAAPYITLAHIYARAGLLAEVAEIRKLMEEKGLKKSVGWSWIEDR